MSAEYEDFARFGGFSGVELEAVMVGKGQVTAPCPWCGSSHRHGAGEGWREAHCGSSYAIRMGPCQYRLMPRRGVEFATVKAAQRSFAPLSAVNLLARLHPAERQFPLAMRSLLNVALRGARRSPSPWRVAHIEMPLDGLGRLEVSTRGGWLWVPEAGRDEPLCHGGNLLSLLAALSGASAGLYAAETLEAFTGFRVSGLSRAALRDFFDRFDGSHSRLLAGSRPETLWAISASLKVASLHPLMLSLLTGLFPRGAASESAFFYENARAGVRFTVLRGGRWVGRFRQQEAQIRAHGRDVISLLTLLSGIEAGFWAERILTTALGLDLPGDERGRLAQGVGEAMSTAVLSFEGDAK